MIKISSANLAGWDRALRIAVGVTVLALGTFGAIDGELGVACRLFGWVPLATGAIGWSPLYAILGISTRPRHRR